MKRTLIALTLLLTCSAAFSQRITDVSKEVKHIRLPLIPMDHVKTYDCKWNFEKIAQDVPGINTSMGYNEQTIKGILSLQGYTYSTVNPDIVITLNCEHLIIPSPEIIDIDDSSTKENYRAKYTIPANWTITVEGKHTASFPIDDEMGGIVVYIPAIETEFGTPGQEIPKAEFIEKHLSENGSTVLEYVKNVAVAELFTKAKKAVRSQLSYSPILSMVEVRSFKSSKKEDMSAWDQPYARGIELLNKLNSGESPCKLYNEFKDIFEFWDNQYEQHKNNPSEHSKIISVACSNLVSLLTLTNPEALKPEYFEAWSKTGSPAKNWNTTIIDSKKRFASNGSNKVNYETLSKLPPLKGTSYQTVYTNIKGEKKDGVIEFNSSYGMNPFETGNSFSIYDNPTYIAANGNVSAKQKLKQEEIADYELFGKKYIKMKFTDPTAVSIGGNESFLEEVIVGKCSLYKNYVLETSGDGEVAGFLLAGSTKDQLIKSRLNPLFVVKYGKKASVVFNYTRLANTLEECKTVSDKIKAGAYGNKETAEKTSKLGKFMQQGAGNEITEEIIIKITEEFNSLM